MGMTDTSKIIVQERRAKITFEGDSLDEFLAEYPDIAGALRAVSDNPDYQRQILDSIAVPFGIWRAVNQRIVVTFES
jgi:hypothetical protein